jgi:hypothetical protein
MLDGIPAEVVVDWPTTDDWTRIEVGWVMIVIVSVPVGTIEFGTEMVAVGAVTTRGMIAADVLTGVVVDTGEARPLLETSTNVSVPEVVVGLTGADDVGAAGAEVGEIETVGIIEVSVGVVLTPLPEGIGTTEERASVGVTDTPVVAPVIPERGTLNEELTAGMMLMGLPVGAAESADDTSETIAGTIGTPVEALPVEAAGRIPVPAPVKPELSTVVAAAGKETGVGTTDSPVLEMIVPNPTMIAVEELEAATSGAIAGSSVLFAAGD